jgi:very-short-patch-repair endonuclease
MHKYYNWELTELAKEHRKNQTKAEWLFWSVCKDRQILWYKFRREKVFWNFILDFYCAELKLWIEIDWWYHDYTWEYDEERSNFLKEHFGIEVIRFTNDEIEKNLDWVVAYLEEIIKKMKIW